MRKTIRAAVAAVLALATVRAFAAVTAQDYVQDGLIAHWDGIENVGYGQHDAQATVWKNLVAGGLDLTLQNGAQWGPCALLGNGKLVASNAATLDYQTIEIVFANEKTGANAWLFSNGVSKYVVLATGRVQWINSRAIRTFSFSTTGTHSLSWVNDKAAYIDGTATSYGDYNDTWGAGNSGIHLGARNKDNAYGFTGKYFAIRIYNRELTAAEVAANHAVDAARFMPGTYTWAGTAASDWSDAANWTVDGAAAPRVPQKDDAVVIPAETSATITSDQYGFASLTVDGSLSIAPGVAVGVYTAARGGAALPRNIYTGSGTGVQVPWITGSGVLRVAGGADRGIPDILPTPAGGGWYEFGITTENGGRTWQTNSWHIVADWPKWDRIAFPADAKVRFVGYTILDTIPDGVFSEVDFTHAEYILLHGKKVFASGAPFTIPPDVTLRYQPGNWEPQSNPDEYELTTEGSGAMTTPLNVLGTLYVYGDRTRLARQEFAGLLTGTGTFRLGSYSNQARFTGGFAFNGSVTGFQNSQVLWVDSLAVTSSLAGITFSTCGDTHQTNANHNVNGLFFGKHNSDATADHELYIASLDGNARDITDVNGKRWRSGGALGIWGGNTIHVGKVTYAVHVVGRPQDLGCNNGWLNSATSKGFGNLVVDESSATGSLFLSTNVNVTVGQVTASTCFNYSYHSNAVNRTTLDITNFCSASARVLATDLGMLPARISGFKGMVALTDTATKSYTMPIDFTHGTNTLYNTVGCIGSGTLESAPAGGTIDVTFPTTGDVPVRGRYALARFTSGGDKLAGWTVTLNGESVNSVLAVGMKVEVKKDKTGLWLKVEKPGLALVFR